MRRCIAWILAMALCLSLACLAETDSNAYILQMDDPRLYEYGNYDTALVDASGLRLQFSLLTDRESTVGADIAGYVGDERNLTVARARFQIDPQAISLTAEGLSSVYALYGRADSTTAPSLAATLSEIASALRSDGLSAEERGDIRRQYEEALVSPYATSTEEGADGTRYAFHVDAKLGDMIDQDQLDALLSGAGYNSAAEIGAYRLKMDGACLVGADGARLSLEAEGALSAADSDVGIPVRMSLVDENADFSLNATATSGQRTLTLDLSALTDPATFRRSADGVLALDGTRLIEIACDWEDAEEGEVNFALRLGDNAVTFKGLRGETFLDGTIWADFNVEGLSGSVSTDIRLGVEGADSADWKLNTANAVDIMNMTSGQSLMLTMGAAGVAANALARIRNNAPALEPLFSALTDAVMGALG